MIVPSRTNVLHMIDTLRVGGAERMAVNLVNSLPRDRFVSHLCTTRHEGPFAEDVDPQVPRLRLMRRWRFDLYPILKLVRYVRDNRITILHAHGSTLFLARLVAAVVPDVHIVWHDHYGPIESTDRPAWIYRFAVQNIAAVISVSAALAEWTRDRLAFPANRIWKLRNFALHYQDAVAACEAPLARPVRVVCLANLRPEKGHRDLLEAIAMVKKRVTGVQLLLIGSAPDSLYQAQLQEDVDRLNLGETVAFLGQREDVSTLLSYCTVGVLSSHSEGLPLAILEYGLAGLAVVATDVGECAEVLDGGSCGILVETRQPILLANAIERLLQDQELRSDFAARLSDRVESHYSKHEAIRQLCEIYEIVLRPLRTNASRDTALVSKEGREVPVPTSRRVSPPHRVEEVGQCGGVYDVQSDTWSLTSAAGGSLS